MTGMGIVMTPMEKREARLKRQEEKNRLLQLQRLKEEEEQLLKDEKYMKAALSQAKKAGRIGEVPIGAVIVYEDRIIARGYNRRNTDKSTLAHAEITAIRKAAKVVGDWRLEGCTIYITLEPCQMCAGAIVQARIKRAVIGAMNPKAGCAGSILNILEMREFNHRVDVTRNVLENECSSMLKAFFASMREAKALIKNGGEWDAEK